MAPLELDRGSPDARETPRALGCVISEDTNPHDVFLNVPVGLNHRTVECGVVSCRTNDRCRISGSTESPLTDDLRHYFAGTVLPAWA